MSILVSSSSQCLAHNVVGHVCGVTKECFLSPLLLSLLHLLHVSATAIPISAACLTPHFTQASVSRAAESGLSFPPPP